MEPEIRLKKVCVKDMARQLEASMYGRPSATDGANASEEDAFSDAGADVTYVAAAQNSNFPSANSSGYGSTESETFRTSDVLHTQQQNEANHSDEEEVFLRARSPDESDIFSEEFEKTFSEEGNIANTLCESIQDILLVSAYSQESLLQQSNSVPFPPREKSALDYIPSAYFPVPNDTVASRRGIHAQRNSPSNYPVQNTTVIPPGQSIPTPRSISLGHPQSSSYSVEVHQEPPAYPSEPPTDEDIDFNDYSSSPSITESHPKPASLLPSDYSVPYNGFSARHVEIPVYVQNQNFDINYQIPNSVKITPPHHFPKLSLKTFRQEPEVAIVSSEPEEDWPPPPDNLDQFSDEQEYFAAQENSSKPTQTLLYPQTMADSADPSDRETAKDQRVPRFAIRDPIPEENEVFDDSVPGSRSRRSLPNYENVVLARSKSERTARQAHYENVDTDFMMLRRNSDTARQSRGPAYENVVLLPNTQRKHVQCAQDFYGDEQEGEPNGVSQDSGYYRSDGEPGHVTLSPPSRRGPPMQMVDDGSEDDEEEDDDDEEEEDDDDDSSDEESDNSYFTDSDFDDDDLNDEVHTMSEDQLSMIISDMNLSSDSSDTIPKERLTSSTSSVDSASSQPSSLVVELLRMERAHVERLHFLCRVVLLNLKVLTHLDDVTVLPTDVIKQIFSNIEVIYSFHSTDLLPGLEDKVNSWSEKSTIGDLLKRVVPFFKLYTDFAENFTKKLQLYDTWLAKSKLFAVLVREIESTPECRRLSLKQHLLDVVHYVSKYQAMLKDYTENLLENAEEKTEIEETVALIDSTVRDLERAMGKEERMKKLRDVQSRIEGSKTAVVKPTRDLTKEGKIKIIGQETGKKLDRYVFLFNDSLLLCTPAGMGSKHRVRFWLDVEGMQINNGDNLEYPNTFYVLNKRKAVEFHASSHEAKMDWVEAIRGVIDNYTKTKISGHLVCFRKQDIVDDDIGKTPPRLVQACLVSACTLCAANLGAMKKKHHCKACGHVICGKCCTHKLPLEFDKKRQSKVCDECYVILRSQDIKDEEEMWTEQTVSREDPAKISGNLAMSSQTGKSWHKRYIAVNHNGLLYCYKNRKDSKPWSNLPLRRFRLSLTSKTDSVHKANIFKLLNSRKTYYFQATTAEEAKRWIEVISDIVDSEV